MNGKPWLIIELAGSPDDPYSLLKDSSNLLCKTYCDLNSIYTGSHYKYKTADYWLNRIKSSESALIHQLDRIYLHRNQVVHSGKFINEYSNLWAHLEWYVGKLISFAVIERLKGKKSLEDIFMGLEADHDQLISVLEKNKDKKINEIKDFYTLAFKHSWQSF
jgi:hypothetical protein